MALSVVEIVVVIRARVGPVVGGTVFASVNVVFATKKGGTDTIEDEAFNYLLLYVRTPVFPRSTCGHILSSQDFHTF